MTPVKSSPNLRRTYAIDLLLLFLTGMAAFLLINRGWKNKEFHNLDMYPYYRGATDFLRSGQLLQAGDFSSYFSWNPPGTYYFLLPGMLMTSDPRVQGLLADGIVFFLTLLFFYLAARELAGRIVALPAALALAISRVGYQGIWPVGHPVFVVAMMYFLTLWIKRKSTMALAFALITVGFGLYVDLAILPILLVIPCLWIIFRPPIGWRSLLISIAIVLAIWFPYLRFEGDRGFVDIASILLRRPVDHLLDFSQDPIYCYAAAPGEADVPDGIYLPYIGGKEIEAHVVYPLPGWANQLSYGVCRILLNIDRNFDNNLFLLGDNRLLATGLWWLFLTGFMTIVFAAVRGVSRLAHLFPFLTFRRRVITLLIAAGGSLLLFLFLNPEWLGSLTADGKLDRNIFLSVQQLQEFSPWIWAAMVVGWLLAASIQVPKPMDRILAVGLAVPWIILVGLAEPGRPERFWFIWPLQILIMALVLYWLLREIAGSMGLYWISILLLCAGLLPATLYAQQITQWSEEGFSGPDSSQWKTIDFLSQQAAYENSRKIRVLYRLSYVPGFVGEGPFQQSDWFDYILDSRYGIRNAARGEVEGMRGDWEIVDATAGIPDDLQTVRPIMIFGEYSVFRIP